MPSRNAETVRLSGAEAVKRAATPLGTVMLRLRVVRPPLSSLTGTFLAVMHAVSAVRPARTRTCGRAAAGPLASISSRQRYDRQAV